MKTVIFADTMDRLLLTFSAIDRLLTVVLILTGSAGLALGIDKNKESSIVIKLPFFILSVACAMKRIEGNQLDWQVGEPLPSASGGRCYMRVHTAQLCVVIQLCSRFPSQLTIVRVTAFYMVGLERA